MLELLIVVSILVILASVAVPKYADVLRKAQEGSLKGNLGTLRSALQIYYSDNEGVSPSCIQGANSTMFNTVLVPKYIDKIPPVNSGLHPATNSVYCDSKMVAGSVHDGQGWYYDGTFPQDSGIGVVWVACDHTDSAGNSWTSY